MDEAKPRQYRSLEDKRQIDIESDGYDFNSFNLDDVDLDAKKEADYRLGDSAFGVNKIHQWEQEEINKLAQKQKLNIEKNNQDSIIMS